MPMGKPDDPVAQAFLEGLAWNNEHGAEAAEDDKFFWEFRLPFAGIEEKPATAAAENVDQLEADTEKQVEEGDVGKLQPPTVGKQVTQAQSNARPAPSAGQDRGYSPPAGGMG